MQLERFTKIVFGWNFLIWRQVVCKLILATIPWALWSIKYMSSDSPPAKIVWLSIIAKDLAFRFYNSYSPSTYNFSIEKSLTVWSSKEAANLWSKFAAAKHLCLIQCPLATCKAWTPSSNLKDTIWFGLCMKLSTWELSIASNSVICASLWLLEAYSFITLSFSRS